MGGESNVGHTIGKDFVSGFVPDFDFVTIMNEDETSKKELNTRRREA